MCVWFCGLSPNVIYSREDMRDFLSVPSWAVHMSHNLQSPGLVTSLFGDWVQTKYSLNSCLTNNEWRKNRPVHIFPKGTNAKWVRTWIPPADYTFYADNCYITSTYTSQTFGHFDVMQCLANLSTQINYDWVASLIPTGCATPLLLCDI